MMRHKGHHGETFVFKLRVNRWENQCPAMPGSSHDVNMIHKKRSLCYGVSNT